jgi:hypothetical protein
VPAGVEGEHAGGQDQPVHGERDQSGGQAALAVCTGCYAGELGATGGFWRG